MAKKAFELSFQIGGKLASSFSNVFSKSTKSLEDLKQEARQTQRALDQLGNDFRKGKIHQSQYAEQTERLTRELKQLEAAQRRVGAFKSTMQTGFSNAKMYAGIAAVGTAAAATGLAFKTMDVAADFESQMAKVGTKAQATQAEMKALNETALQLGASTSLSASEVAAAMDELAAKGFDATKAIAAMPGIIAATEASGEDLAITSDVVTSALNAFELQADKSTHVADVMAMSANRTAAGVQDLGYSFKYAAPVAKTLGISLEELASATGVMVDRGLAGEQAGTSLRTALIRLSDPPKEAQNVLKKLNLTVTDSQGKFKSLSKISDEWNKATKNLSQTQKVQYASTVFGTEAATGMLNLFAAGGDVINEMTEALENSDGAAAAAAKTMKDNYGGALEELGGSIESAQIKFATPILPVFKDVFNGLSSSLDENMGGIERAGERTAAALRSVFEPLSTQKPEKPVLAEVGNIALYQDLLNEYNQDLDKFNKYNGMDFGDKVVYMLDEAADKIENWLSGSGGESMDKIFSKLGELAAKAYVETFTGTVKAAGSNFAQGNVFAGLGLGAAAWMLGGGLMVKGAIGAGKWGYGKVRGSKATQPSAKGSTVPDKVKSPLVVVPDNKSSKSGKVVPFPTKDSGKAIEKAGGFKDFFGKTSKALKPVGKFVGKAAWPAAITMGAYDVVSSNNKPKAAAETGGGLAGGWGGAKLGAIIGTAIAPGIGTAIGGLLGGAGGFIAGKWIGGKAADAAQGNKASTKSAPAATVTVSDINTTAINQSIDGLKSAISLTTQNFNTLTTYTGMASGQVVGAFSGIKTSGDLLIGNLDILTTYTAQASGWLASLNGIQSAGQRVIQALNSLEQRINSIDLPGPKSKRVSFDG